MKLQWTQHAQDVFSKRKVPIEWIDRAVDDPDLMCADKVDPELEYYLVSV